jgi:hypothetical protein
MALRLYEIVANDMLIDKVERVLAENDLLVETKIKDLCENCAELLDECLCSPDDALTEAGEQEK